MGAEVRVAAVEVVAAAVEVVKNRPTRSLICFIGGSLFRSQFHILKRVYGRIHEIYENKKSNP